MSGERSGRDEPSDWTFYIGLLVIIPAIVILSNGLSPFVTTDLAPLFWTGLGIAGLGTVLLMSARLPLYRPPFRSGADPWPSFHRRLYWTGYVVMLAGLGLLGFIWRRLS
jgi:hypothetical protein